DLEYIGADVPAVEDVAAETTIARFPGGDDVSGFVWDLPTTGSCAQPRWTWDAMADLAARSHMGLMLETNILRQTPDGIVAWVQDARRRGLRVPFVGIGNEVWGSWDAGYRSAAQYALDVRAAATALRA